MKKLSNFNLSVPDHWFWKSFEEGWEPQTFDFFERYLIKNTEYLDIGAWIGPTAIWATKLGASKLKLVEPNPFNFLCLLETQIQNSLFDSWCIINACVSDKRGTELIGPMQGLLNRSSATTIKNQITGADILSIKLEDLKQNYSLIKIDIEGSEELIVDDLKIFSDVNAAIWLSLHPPFMEDIYIFCERVQSLYEYYYVVEDKNNLIDYEELCSRIISKEDRPAWGTNYGNFFEIGLLPKQFFTEQKERK